MDRDEYQYYLPTSNKLIWDCGSSLYDSFELTSFKRQLDAAIAARCFSMPHLSGPPEPPAPTTTTKKKHSSKLISRAVQKLVKSVFQLRSTFVCSPPSRRSRADDHVVSGLSGRENSDFGFLSSIPEVCEKDLSSPDLAPAARKTVSERFISTAVELEKMY